jgi:hypothetical protein
MKNVLKVSVLAVAAMLLQGCATSVPVGGLFTDLQLPVAVTSNAQGTKIGIAKCKSVLGLVATGDCSLEAAKKQGGITEVTHVDWKANNILGIIGEYELIVHGR